MGLAHLCGASWGKVGRLSKSILPIPRNSPSRNALKFTIDKRPGILYSASMDINTILTSADEFQLLHRQLAVSARTQALARANAAARATVRRMDKAATLAALDKRLRRS
jgi:hypothetical protein